MGGRFGRMTTLDTNMSRSFDPCRCETLRPFTALTAETATKELGDIDLHPPDEAAMRAAWAAMGEPESIAPRAAGECR